MSEKIIRIGITEDDSFFMEEFSQRIHDTPGFELVYACSNGKETLNVAGNIQPDVAIMDLGLPDITGSDLILKLREFWPLTQFLVCSAHDQDEYVFHAIKNSATGYILKSDTTTDFVNAIKELADGGSPMSPQIARMVLGYVQGPRKINPPDAALTGREMEIVEQLSAGLRYKEIGSKLFISTETVRKHINNIYKKLEVQSRTEALNKLYK